MIRENLRNVAPNPGAVDAAGPAWHRAPPAPNRRAPEDVLTR